MNHGITVNKLAGNINFDLPTSVGDVRVTLGGADDEFVYVDGTYSYRGRKYTGRIMLDNRRNFAVKYGYGWTLKTASGQNPGKTASQGIYETISGIVIPALREYLAKYPELKTKGEQARVANSADRLAKEISEAEQKLAEMRAEHRRLLALADALKNGA